MYFSQYGKLTIRPELGSAFIPAVPLLLLIMTVPESPRWLILKGRHPEAYYSLKRLRGREMLLVIREFLYLENSIQRPADVRSEYGRFTFIKLGTLLNKRRKRNALVAACIVMASQQLCGSEYSMEPPLYNLLTRV